MFHDDQHIQQPESGRYHDAEVTSDDGGGVIPEEGGPTLIAARLAGGPNGTFGRYLRTVRGDTRRPSFSNNSSAMRSSPHEGFSRAILRIRTLEVKRNRRAARLAFATPVKPEAPAVPTDEGSGCHDGQGAAPIEPATEPQQGQAR